MAVRPSDNGVSLAGKVEQVARESWARFGLRIFPSRLQGLGRL